MKKSIQFLSFVVAVGVSLTASAQEVTTPSGTPLSIGGNGVRLLNINSAAATVANPGSGVLGVNAAGDIIYVPGAASQWTTGGSNINYNTVGNVGIGVPAPAYKLDINGDINIPTGSALRVNGGVMLRNFGTDNLAIGLSAGSTVTGTYNTFIGRSAGQAATTGTSNVGIGYAAGYSNTGDNNTFVGSGTGGAAGSNNAALGYNAGASNTGTNNIFVGSSSGGTTNTGNGNIFLGASAGQNNTTGASNFMGGYGAGQGNKTGDRGTFLGAYAGYTADAAGNGSDNTCIGYSSGVAPGVTNSVAIGSSAIANVSNAFILGGATSKIGIGTSSPTAKLEVNSGTAGVSGLKFTNFNSTSTPTSTGGTSRVLSVNSTGEVILVQLASAIVNSVGDQPVSENWKKEDGYLYNNSTNGVVINGTGLDGNSLIVKGGVLSKEVNVKVEGSESWPDYVFTPNYKRMSLGDVEKFINVNGHLPNVPSATQMVETGNNLNKTDIKLLEKIEELTLYMIEIEKRLAKTEAENLKLKKSVKGNK
jgi:trimeric autotransporter adhesin